LFVILLIASIVMGAVLWNQLRRDHERLLQGQDSAPTVAPQVAPDEEVTLLVANDDDNSLHSRALTLPLPENADARARVVLGKLFDLYAAKDAQHPVPGGAAAVADVFLLPEPASSADSSSAATGNAKPVAADADGDGPELAVVNLTNAFATAHPSGIETESLTILSICATLHENLPRVDQVRFLVDGQLHATLAGHADLTRTYLAAEAVPTTGAHP
jgi:hypothetical protein